MWILYWNERLNKTRFCSEDARFVWKRASHTHQQVRILVTCHPYCYAAQYNVGVMPILQNGELKAAFAVLQQLWNKNYQVW